MPASPAKFDFETLKAESFGVDAAWLTTFAYWLGALADPTSEFARDAEDSCAAMSCQYDIEEQAFVIDDLRSRPELIPKIFRPVAPVTLALRWSPFPAAIAALGAPVHIDRGAFSRILAIFRPVDSPALSAATPDERHFGFLLRHACERAFRAKSWILLTGAPGWAYESEDLITGDRHRQKLMADFGFVSQSRRP